MYTDTSLLGKQEATNFDTIDLAFIRAIADRSCSNVRNAPVTKAFIKNCNIIQTIYRRGLRIGWTESELCSVSKSIKIFKDYSRSVFERYQVSGTATFKWHCFKSLVNSLRAVSGTVWVHASHYEIAHKMFKRAYLKTLEQNGSAMEKTLMVLVLQS